MFCKQQYMAATALGCDKKSCSRASQVFVDLPPPGKDGGLDIIAHPDPLGTRSPRIKVEVKRTETRKSPLTVFAHFFR